MNYTKLSAIIFSLLSFGALQETNNVFRSPVTDVYTKMFAVGLTFLMFGLATRFWLKVRAQNKSIR